MASLAPAILHSWPVSDFVDEIIGDWRLEIGETKEEGKKGGRR